MSPEETLMARALNDEADDIVRVIVKEHISECRTEVDSHINTIVLQLQDLAASHRTLEESHKTLEEINTSVKAMKEIIDAWNSAKGFVNTIKFLSVLIKGTALVGGTVGLVWYIMTHGAAPPK